MSYTLLPGEMAPMFFPGATVPINSIECMRLFDAWGRELEAHAIEESERLKAEHLALGEEWRADVNGIWAWRKI